MAVLDITSDIAEIRGATYTLGRATTLRFRLLDEVASSTPLAFGQEVRWVVGGVVRFLGRVVPSRRELSASVSDIEYLASDAVEWLGNNPCDEVNEFYNLERRANMGEYPRGMTVEDIIDAEFQRITGNPALDTDHIFLAVDWSRATAIRDLVPFNFTTQGKTWLELLDSLANEIPNLTFWLDPTGVATDNTHVRGYTLRFYDLSDIASATLRTFNAPKSLAGSADATNPSVTGVAESVSLAEDASQSYDTLIFHGWGEMSEVYERLTPAWGTYPGDTGSLGVLLREDPSSPATGAIEQHNGTGGFVAATSAWHPNQTLEHSSHLYRRYEASGEIADIRLVIDESTIPPSYRFLEGATEVESLFHFWYAGNINVSNGLGNFSGIIFNGLKSKAWANEGDAVEIGEVRPTDELYPNYPDGPFEAKASIGTPASVQGRYVFLAEPLIYQTWYQWTSNATDPNDPAFDSNFTDARHFVYWGVGDDVWMRYTKREPFSVTKTDGSLGYGKTLVLHDNRFLTYTNFDGDVLRDDTTALDEFATALFDLIKAPRITGQVRILIDPTVMTLKPGDALRVRYWNGDGSGDTYLAPQALIQSVEFSAMESWSLAASFDNPNAFVALENTKRFRSFFEANDIVGATADPISAGPAYSALSKESTKGESKPSENKKTQPQQSNVIIDQAADDDAGGGGTVTLVGGELSSDPGGYTVIGAFNALTDFTIASGNFTKKYKTFKILARVNGTSEVDIRFVEPAAETSVVVGTYGTC